MGVHRPGGWGRLGASLTTRATLLAAAAFGLCMLVSAGARPAALPWPIADAPPPTHKSLAQVFVALPYLLQGGARSVGLTFSIPLLAPAGAGAGAGAPLYNQTLYVQPEGRLTQRLLAVASALTAGRQRQANVVIVWPSRQYDALFYEPELPYGSFPPNCTVHTLHEAPPDWKAIAGLLQNFDRWGRVWGGPGGRRKRLTPKPTTTNPLKASCLLASLSCTGSWCPPPTTTTPTPTTTFTTPTSPFPPTCSSREFGESVLCIRTDMPLLLPAPTHPPPPPSTSPRAAAGSLASPCCASAPTCRCCRRRT